MKNFMNIPDEILLEKIDDNYEEKMKINKKLAPPYPIKFVKKWTIEDAMLAKVGREIAMITEEELYFKQLTSADACTIACPYVCPLAEDYTCKYFYRKEDNSISCPIKDLFLVKNSDEK